LARYVYDFRDGSREYVFLTETGTPFTYYGFQRIFRSLKKRSGLPRFSAHILRHTASSSLMRAGTGNVLELQRQMGWSNVRMAMR
jgi:integrase